MNTMNFWDELKKRMYWGAWLGIIFVSIQQLIFLVASLTGLFFTAFVTLIHNFTT